MVVIENPLEFTKLAVNGHLMLLSDFAESCNVAHAHFERAATAEVRSVFAFKLLSLTLGMATFAIRTSKLREITNEKAATKHWAATVFN